MGRMVIKYHREYRDLSIEQVKREFVSNCFLANWYLLKPGLGMSESVKKINHFMFEVVRYYRELRCRGEEGWQALKELCSHPDESARLRAAAYYRLRDPDYALPIIRQMAINPDFWAPRTVKRHVAFHAQSLVRELGWQQAGEMEPYPDDYECWLQELEAEGQGKSPKVKYVETVVPYRGEYSGLSLEQIRARFLELSLLKQSLKNDDTVSYAQERKQSANADRELYMLYFELRERGEAGVNLLREIATSGPISARLQAGILLQWQDTKLACDTLSELGDQLGDYEQGSIEYETCSDAVPESAVLGPVLENTAYATVDPYDQWKESQTKKGN